MGKRNGHQKGAPQHDETGHGDKTHAAFIEELQGQPAEQDGGSAETTGNKADAASHDEGEADVYGRPITTGHRRLEEGREQHDEAEKNSEANRLRR